LGSFGEKLRRQREQRGIALDQISNVTKISTRMLRALEQEHFDQLPGGVFNKGFVRAYARHVGLNEEEAISDYLAALRESQVQQQAILPDFRTGGVKSADLDSRVTRTSSTDPSAGKKRVEENQSSTERNSRADIGHATSAISVTTAHSVSASSDKDALHSEVQTGVQEAGDENQFAQAGESSGPIPWGKLAAALLLIVVGVAILNFVRHRQPAIDSHTIAVTPPPSIAVPDSPASPNSAEENRTKSAPTDAGAVSHPAGTVSQAGEQPAKHAASTSVVLSAAETPASDSSGKFSANPNSIAASKLATQAEKPPASLTLLIRAEKTTWVSVVADGKPVTQEMLIAPANTSVRAAREIIVKAGNAGGISFELNGKHVPVSGPEGAVRTYIFSAAGVQEADQGPQTQTAPANN
jgi:Helix-turn-helix domain/Domain of unknown function (DUF4115)